MKMVDLGAQMEAMGGSQVMLNAMAKVLHSEQFIGGSVVQELEDKLAKFVGMPHAVACANGTDALTLALLELDVKGGTVVVPAFGFPAAAEAAILCGANVAFVDVCPDDGMMAPDRLALLLGGSPGRRPRAIIVMDLFGTPAKYDLITSIAKDYGIPLICDAAQSIGAEWGAEGHVCKAAQFGDMTTTSFFPAKPLGCYGDGGMVFTKSEKQAERLRELRNHGMGKLKYHHNRVGLNSRLDALQAVVLLKKLELFPAEIDQRNRLADLFLTMLKEAELPLSPLVPPAHVTSTWACFSLVARVWAGREIYLNRLADAGIPHAIHYPKPLSEQPAYRPRTVYNDGCCPVSRALCGTIFQVPFHPYLTAPDLEKIVSALTG